MDVLSLIYCLTYSLTQLHYKIDRKCLFRCGFCVSHEVDSHYCPNCMENMPSAEARLKKNRYLPNSISYNCPNYMKNMPSAEARLKKNR